MNLHLIALTSLAYSSIAAAQLPEDVSPGVTELPGEVVRVPLDHSSGYAVIDVRFEDTAPFKLLFDTGASLTVLDKSLATELGLEITGEARIGDPTNPTAIPVDVLTIPETAIGDAYFLNMPAVAWDRPAALSRITRGVLGLPTFEDCLVTLDYAKNEMRIEAGDLPPSNGADIIDIEIAESGAIRFPITINGQRITAHLDSGNPRGLVLPERLMNDLDIVAGTQNTSTARMANSSFEMKTAQITNDVAIGSVTLKAPTVSFNSVLEFANVGHVLLAEAAVTIDLKNSRMRIVPNGQEPRAITQRRQAGAQVVNRTGRRPLGIQGYPSATGVTVSTVTPDSLAARAGIRPGDRVVEVAGNSNVGDALQEALSGTEAFSITVERDGEKVKLTVPGETTQG